MEHNHRYKIGVFRALQLGDLLCIIPAVRAIRAFYPSAEVTLIGLPWQKHFVERFHHYFNAFVEFPGWPGLPERPYDMARIPEFLKEMQQQKFDLVLQMQGNGESTNTMCMLWGAKLVVGLRKHNEFCPDEKLFIVSGDDEHEVLRFLKLIKALNIPSQGEQLELPIFTSEIDEIRKKLLNNGIAEGHYICMHPGARDPRRRWPVDRFALLADQLASHGFTIVLTGAEDERELLAQITFLMRFKVINVVEKFGHLPLGELAALISLSMGLVSNDTGVSHIATALNVPSVIIFSQYSNPNRWAPLDTSIHTIVLHEDAANVDIVYDAVVKQILDPIKLRLINA